MNTYKNACIKQLAFAVGVVFTMLFCSIPAKAAYITVFPGTPYEKGDWYAMGDTVSIAFPRVSYTTIQQQITKDQYDNQSATNQWGAEGTYSTEDGYYFYNYTVRDTIILTFSAEPDASGKYSEITGHLASMHGAAADINDMWYIKDATPEVDDQNPGVDKYWPQTRVRMKVQHLKSGKWIAYAANAKGDLVLKLVDSEDAATPFAYDTRTKSENYHYGDYRMTYFNPVIPNIAGNMFYFESVADKEISSVTGTRKGGNYVKMTRSTTYTFRLAKYYNDWMRCFQWSKEHTQHFKIAATPFSTDFGYAADNAAAQAQQMTQSYNISLIDSCELYCKAVRIFNDSFPNKKLSIDNIQLEAPTTISDASVLENTYGISARFFWASWINDADKYNKLNSVLKTKQIDNTMSQSPYNTETSRDMMTMSSASHNGHWTVTVTPNGGSPYNVIDTTARYQGTAISYADLLYCNLVDTHNNDSVVASLGTSFTRRAYHVTTITDSLKVSITPEASLMDSAGGSLTFTVKPIIVNSTIRYAANGAIDEVISREDSAITMNDPAITGQTIKLTDMDNNDITSQVGAWVKIDSTNTDLANNTIVLTFEKSINVNMRGVNLIITGEYKGNSQVLSVYIRQTGTSTTGTYTFKHQEGGYSGYMTTANKRGEYYQKVHTVEKTVYYTSGEEIELMANTPNMEAYWRWYDYDFGTDPRYYYDAANNFKDAGNSFWITAPQDQKRKAFTAIDNGEASKGYYATKDTHTFPTANESQNLSQWTNMMPKITGWSDESEHNIALDVSTYADYTISGTTITEPTLSYRQIWHLRPAKAIADSLDKCTDVDHPYESHEYIAPTDKTVYLATNLPHYQAQHHQSELCYWFNATITTEKGGSSTSRKGYKQAGYNSSYSECATPKWKVSYDDGKTWSDLSNNYATGTDFQQVKSLTTQTVEYALYIPRSGFQYDSTYYSRGRKRTATITVKPTCNRDIYLARFKVTYVSSSTYGPSETALITDEQIAKSYNELAKQDFNFGTVAGSLSTTQEVYYTKPLDPENSTFGFTYLNENGYPQKNRVDPLEKSTKKFPYWGEYCLVNMIDGNHSWTMSSQHGGAANGYMLYVDGKQQPGLAATISTDAQLCSGQQMYCYAWVANAATNNTKPVLRFDVQGRQTNDAEWTSVASFFVGELEYGYNNKDYTKWQQVNFPVLAAESYAHTRIAIYNFANSGHGNDFLVDDVCLYASKLPLTAYQAFTTCKVKNMEVAVARIDYSNMASSGSNQTLYYTFMNTKSDTAIHAVYHYPDNWTGTTSDKHGVIYVPKKGYDPTKSGDSDYQTNSGIAGVDETKMVYASASQILDSLETVYLNDTLPGHTVQDGYTLKGYVKTSDDDGDRYIMYVAHLINDKFMPSSATYQLAMATSEADLAHPECSMSADLPLSNKTNIAFNGSTDPTVGACANGLYPVTVRVNNTVEINGASVNLVGIAKADWLLGYDFDDAYISELNKTDAEKAKADGKFEAKYGYARGKIQDALSELRRYTNHSNYTAQNVDEIVLDTVTAGTNDTVHILLKEHYNIIKDLCDRGLLSLYKDSDAFYMRAKDTIRFWVYPIPGTAKVTYHDAVNNKDTVYTLDNCSNNSFLRGFTDASEYEANVSPIKLVDMTADQKHAVPRVRVAASQVNKGFKIPISDISSKTVFGWDSCRVISTTDPAVQDSMAKNPNFSMRYTQDIYYYDILKKTSSKAYYKAGDSITFKPIDADHVKDMIYRHDNDNNTQWTNGHPGFQKANTTTMRPGYEYTMQATLLNQAGANYEGSCPIGNVYFTVIVVPDTVVWTPVTDYWGDDQNWQAIINGKKVNMGYVPLAETDVVIPTLSSTNERLYPFLCDSNFYPMDAHYVPAKCHKIHFCSNTAMLDQHVLSYDSVYADMSVKAGTWNLVAMPLQGVVSGDFFVPHTGDYTNATNEESTAHFTVSGFKGSRDGQTAGYAAWSRYYNDSVATEHYNAYDGTFSESYNLFTQAASESEGFLMAASNSVSKTIDPCHGFELGVWGPNNDKNENITIRLPKPDTEYGEYFEGAVKRTVNVSTARTNAHKFAFTPDKNGEMKVTLHNEVASPYFLFGNPTMAYIDAESFYYRNSSVLESYFWTLEGDQWVPHSGKLVTYENRFVKPFRAAMVYARGDKLRDLTLTLSTQDLAISYIQGARNNYTDAKHGTPGDQGTTGKVAKRRLSSANGHYLNNGLMHIDAFIRPTDEREATALANFDLVATDFANDGYDISEDVPFFSVNIKDDGTTLSGASEMNIYSVVGTKKVSIDVREQIGVVPLGFVVSNDLRNTDGGKMRLYFTLTDWTDECYLIDTEKGTQTRITNGTELYLDIPTNNAMRYYIQGPKNESEEDHEATDTETISSDKADAASSIFIYSENAGYVDIVASSAIAEVRLYDVVGRLVSERTVTNNTPILSMPAPEGILLTEVTLKNGTRGVEKVIVR